MQAFPALWPPRGHETWPRGVDPTADLIVKAQPQLFLRDQHLQPCWDRWKVHSASEPGPAWSPTRGTKRRLVLLIWKLWSEKGWGGFVPTAWGSTWGPYHGGNCRGRFQG